MESRNILSKPSVKELFKETFKLYQFLYHEPNWKSCPLSIIMKVKKVVNNINLPTSVYSDTYTPYYDFKGRLDRASANFLEEITTICSDYLCKNESLFPWIDFSAHELFLALIMAKKRAKKVYRRINHDIIKKLCQELSEIDPGYYRFEYMNNYIINKSDEISSRSCSDSYGLSSDSEHQEEPSSQHDQENAPDYLPNLDNNRENDTSKDTVSFKPKVKFQTDEKRKESTPKQSNAVVVPFKSIDFSVLFPDGKPSEHEEALEQNDSGYNTFLDSPTPMKSERKRESKSGTDCG